MDLNEIINKNQKNIKNIIRLITKEDNDDLEQKVYIKIWQNINKYKEQGQLKSWVNTIAKNVSRDYLKLSVKKHEEQGDENVLNTIKDKKETPELRLIKNERQQEIINAINSLKPKFKEVILYCEIQGYTYEECAKKLKCPIGTIKSRLYNAKQELANKLEHLMKG